MQRTRALLVVALLHSAAPLHAQPAAAPAAEVEGERAWAKGVPPDKQARALELFSEGDALFATSKHALALAKYREAIEFWDHPAIRYNMAVALIQIDQPLQAYESLTRALRYDFAPFDVETYSQALTYKKLLLAQLAKIKVTCTEPGAEVTLDGERLFEAPRAVFRRVLPGAHQLVAAKAGHHTENRVLVLLPGKLTVETLELRPLTTTVMRRRWRWWTPLLVLAGGVVVAAAAGIPLIVDAQSSRDRYDSALREHCQGGCLTADLPPSVTQAKSQADLELGFSAALFAVGGAAIVTGAVLLILNQPRAVEERVTPERVGLAPTFGAGAAGATAWIRF